MVKTKNCYKEQISWITKMWNIKTQNYHNKKISGTVTYELKSFRGVGVVDYRIKGLSKHFVGNKYSISKLRRKVFM